MYVSSKRVWSVLVLSSTVLLTPIDAVAAKYFKCIPFEVMETAGRVQVRCNNSIEFTKDGTPYAIKRIIMIRPNDDRTKRFADMATTALSCGLTLNVRIKETPHSEQQPGGSWANFCKPSECREIDERFGVRRP
jgi:hypothetical protein